MALPAVGRNPGAGAGVAESVNREIAMSIVRPSWFAALAGLALVAGAQAATVKVSFIEPEKFIDAGDRPAERDQALAALEAYIVQLGTRMLPADLTLTIEVLDVDLAGRIQWLRNGQDKRIIRGGTDWPRITMRYTLSRDGQVQASGTDKLEDLDYTLNLHSARANENLYFEKRLLEEWFATRFADRIVAAAR